MAVIRWFMDLGDLRCCALGDSFPLVFRVGVAFLVDDAWEEVISVRNTSKELPDLFL
jgi:hypothetical protein